MAQGVAERQQVLGARILEAVAEAQVRGECRSDLSPEEIAFGYQALVGQFSGVC